MRWPIRSPSGACGATTSATACLREGDRQNGKGNDSSHHRWGGGGGTQGYHHSGSRPERGHRRAQSVLPEGFEPDCRLPGVRGGNRGDSEAGGLLQQQGLGGHGGPYQLPPGAGSPPGECGAAADPAATATALTASAAATASCKSWQITWASATWLSTRMCPKPNGICTSP